MKTLAILLCGLLTSTCFLCADDVDDTDGPPPIAHYPASFPLWGKAVNGIEVSIAVKPFSTANLPHRQFIFAVCIRNTSAQPVYSMAVGNPPHSLKLKIVDKNNKTALLVKSYARDQVTIHPIAPQKCQIYYVNLDNDDFNAIGNNDVTVLAEVMDKALSKDPGTQKFTVESLPFKVYPLGPERTPLPPDPLRAQLESKAAMLKALMDHATGPGDRSEAAENLVHCYLKMGNIAEARATAPNVTELPSKCDVQAAITLRDPSLTNQQKIEEFRALQKEYPQYPDRVRLLENFIGIVQYQNDHPDSFE